MLDALEGRRDSCFLGEPIRRRPVLPSSAPTRCPAVRRLDATRSWYVRASDSKDFYVSSTENTIRRIQNPGIPRRVGTGRRTAGRWGGAGIGSTGRRRVDSPRRQPIPSPPRQSKKTLLDLSLEARTKEILCEPMGEQSQRLTIGL